MHICRMSVAAASCGQNFSAASPKGRLRYGKAWEWCNGKDIDYPHLVISFIDDDRFVSTFVHNAKADKGCASDFPTFKYVRKQDGSEIIDPGTKQTPKHFYEADLDHMLDVAIEIATELLKGKSVFVGCRGGKNRSPTLCGIAYAFARAFDSYYVDNDERYMSKQDDYYMGGLVRLANNVVDIGHWDRNVSNDLKFATLKTAMYKYMVRFASLMPTGSKRIAKNNNNNVPVGHLVQLLSDAVKDSENADVADIANKISAFRGSQKRKR